MEPTAQTRRTMTFTLHLPPDIERKLQTLAAQNGQSVERFIQQLVEREASAIKGGQPTVPPVPDASSSDLPSDKALAPFRREVESSGMSDDELQTFFEEAREEVYQEKHGKPSKAS
jgi:hypothetical protein